MHTLEKIRDILMRELDQCAEQNNLSSSALDTVDKLTHSIKSIDTILAMEDAGHSYAGARRDSMGRYSRNSYRDGYNRGSYDYNRGYSREDAKSDLMEHLRDMSMGANGEHKQMIDEWMRQVESR